MDAPQNQSITRSYAFYALVVIFLANFVNYLDRLLVSAVLTEIQGSFNLELGSGKAGFLWTAFTLGYMAVAPFVGYLSERKSRTKLLALCILIWSLATVMTGVVKEYWLLILMRVFTGVGEAGCLIIGPSLISDYFPKSMRGKMLGIFYYGMPIGGVVSYLLGVPLSQKIGWQEVFYIAGAPGFILAGLILFLREPQRGASEEAEAGAPAPTSPKGARFVDYFALLKIKTFLFIVLAQAFAVFTFIPLVHFGRRYLENVRGLDAVTASYLFGGTLAVAGLVGSLVSGALGDRFYRRSKSAYSWIAAACYFMGFLFLLVGLTASESWMWIVCFIMCFFFFFMCMPAVNTQIANIVHSHKRAMAFAVAVFATHVIGDTISPLLYDKVVGIFNPLHEKTIEAVAMQKTFLIFSASLLLSGLCCVAAARFAKRESAGVSQEPPAP